MKKKIIVLGTLTAVFALGLGVAAVKTSNQTFSVVEAEQHKENYADYRYAGTYYDNFDFKGTEGLNGSIRTSLTSLIFPKAWYTYGSSGSNHLSTQLQYADQDPTNPDNMIYLYTRNSVRKNAASTWNREHVWPQSQSNNCWGTSNAGTDILHIRPTYNTTNSVRGNDKYGDTNKSGLKTYTADGLTMEYGWSNGTYFEPLDSVKGDVARIIMYTWVAYKNYYASLPGITNAFQSYDVMLKWHTMDRPDALEGLRNNYAETSIQKNRNPFVDHPELAWKIFGENCSADVVNQCKAVYTEDGPVTRVLERLEITGDAKIKTYYAGDAFKTDGLKVMAYYNDLTSKDVTTDVTWAPNPLTEGATSVTCTYGGVSATYEGILVLRRPGGNTQPEEPDNKKGANGCSGSIIGTTSVIGASALFGLAIIFLKKKRK